MTKVFVVEYQQPKILFPVEDDDNHFLRDIAAQVSFLEIVTPCLSIKCFLYDTVQRLSFDCQFYSHNLFSLFAHLCCFGPFFVILKFQGDTPPHPPSTIL